MQNHIFGLSATARLTAIAILAASFLTSCSDDDNEPESTSPSTEESTSDIKVFSGELTTTLPAMPDFEPVNSLTEATLEWDDQSHSSATITLSSFTISTGMPGRDYLIGDMTIEDIKCVTNGKDVTLSADSFTCQAGDYAVTGSLEGSYTSDENLTFTIVYKPGSMPFDVKSVFTSL